MIRKSLKKFVYRIRGEYTVEDLCKVGLKVGKNFNPQLGFEIDPSHCWLIEIGDNVTFGPHVQVLAHDASTYSLLGYTKIGKVIIGNNVFIGAGAIILPNVSIGDNTIVGAGSVVTHSIPRNMVCAGNPAKLIMSIEEFRKENYAMMEGRPQYGEEFTLRKHIDSDKKRQQQCDLNDGVGFVK